MRDGHSKKPPNHPQKTDVCERFLQKHSENRKIVEDSYRYYTFVLRGAETASNSRGRWSSLGDSAAACQKGILHVGREREGEGERERGGDFHWYIELVFIRRSSFARYTYNIVLHHWFSAQQKLYLHPGIFQKNVFTVHKLCFRWKQGLSFSSRPSTVEFRSL